MNRISGIKITEIETNDPIYFFAAFGNSIFLALYCIYICMASVYTSANNANKVIIVIFSLYKLYMYTRYIYIFIFILRYIYICHICASYTCVQIMQITSLQDHFKTRVRDLKAGMYIRNFSMLIFFVST